ncbi:MAG: MBL fold metallo-hydrolase [Corynebacterium sp.]|nr:MBL fold metallo-hydrolase [Corynebacterium sp.]
MDNSGNPTITIAGFATGPFQANCYIISDGQRAVAIDPGYTAARVVTNHLAEQGLYLEKVILTHGHIDHTRDAGELAVPVYAARADWFMITDPAQGVSAQAIAAHDVAHMHPIEQLEELAAGPVDICGQQFTAVSAPGHSPGCMLLVGEEIVFSGDVLFAGSIGRTDLPGSDPDEMKKSLATQVATLPGGLHVLPGHGPGTTIAQELATNPYLTSSFLTGI